MWNNQNEHERDIKEIFDELPCSVNQANQFKLTTIQEKVSKLSSDPSIRFDRIVRNDNLRYLPQLPQTFPRRKCREKSGTTVYPTSV